MAGPGGVEVGRASVRVLPDTTKFRSSLEKYLKRTERSLRLELPLRVKADINSAFKAGKHAVAMAQTAAGDLDIRTDVDAAELAKDTASAVSQAEKAAPEMDVDTDVDATSLISQVRRAVAAAQKLAGDIDVRLNLRGGAAAVGMAALNATMAAGSISSRLLSTGIAQAALSMGGLIAMAGAATVAVSGLAAPLVAVGAAAVSALAPIAALGAASAVAGITAAGLAVGVLKTALSGMGDALSADSVEDFNKAIADMPASAQEGAKALRGLKEQFQDVGKEVQSGFWSQLSNIGDLSVLIAPLKNAMAGLAMDMGNATAGLVDFISQGAGLSAVRTLLHHGSSAAASLSYAFADVTKGIISVGAAASPVISELSGKLSELAAGWAQKMQQGFTDGSLQEYFRNAIDNAKQFWGVLQQLGSIVSGVFSAMNAAGAPFLGTIGQAITATQNWVNSAQGMETLTTFFSSMTTAVGAVLPIFGQLASMIGTVVAPAIAGLATAVAPAMSALVDGLSQGLAAIAPAVAPLGAALGQVATALAPILPALGEMAGTVMGALTPAFAALTPLATMLSGVFTTLAPVIGTIGEVLGTVLTAALTAMVPLWDAFGQAVQLLAPILQMLAETIGGLLTEAITMLAPYVPLLATAFMQILQAVAPLLPIIIQIASSIISALMPVIAALLPVVAQVIMVAANIISALAPVIAIVLRVAGVFLQLLAAIVSFVAGAIGLIMSFVASVIGGFVSLAASVIGAISGMVSGVIGFITSMASGVISRAQSMWNGFVSAVSSGIARAISLVGSLPGKVQSALGNLGSLLVGSGKALIQGFINGIKGMLGSVANAAKAVVQKARDFFPFSPAKKGPFSGRGYTTYSGKALATDFAGGIASHAHLAARATNKLMSAAASNVNGYRAGISLAGGAGGLAAGAGVDTSINIGQLVAADPSAPLDQVKTMQLKAQIKAGLA